jgi:hypothetical protein
MEQDPTSTKLQISRDDLLIKEDALQQWKKFGEIQDRKLLLELSWLTPKTLEGLLKEHPAKPVVDGLKELKHCFSILEKSRNDVVDIAGQFHSRILNGGKSIDYGNVLLAATKEAYTYSVAAITLVQSYRHLLSKVAQIQDSYDELKFEVFGNDGIVDFFSALRKANNHLGVIVANPHYSIHQGVTREVESGISFDRNSILSNSEWNQKAKSYVSGLEKLDVVSLVNQHFKLTEKFYLLMPHRTGILRRADYHDYHRIVLANESRVSLVWLGIHVTTAFNGKLDPYEYLQNYFTADELRRIHAFENNTKDQVEYMISLRDPLGLMDQYTRSELYKLFKIKSDRK